MTYKALPQYLSDFLDYCEVEKGLSSITTKNYSRFLARFFEWLKKNNLERLTPEELSADHVWKYRLWLSRLPNGVRKINPNLTVSTQTRYLIALRAFLAYFHEKDIPSMPTEKIKLPKEKRERLVKFLTLDQVEKLLGSPNVKTETGARDRAILETLFSTGLRVAELAALDQKQLAGAKDKTEFELSIIGKGNYPRIVYFSERAIYWIKEYLTRRTDDDDALFIRLKGPTNAPLRLTTRGIETIVQKHAKAAGLPILATPHTIRHSFATDLMTQGVDLRTIQEFLGHRNIATTQVYTHVTSKRLRDIHKKFHGGRNLKA